MLNLIILERFVDYVILMFWCFVDLEYDLCELIKNDGDRG